MAIPRAERRLFRQPHTWVWVAELVIASGAGVVGASTMSRYAADGLHGHAWAVGTASVIVLVFQFVKSGVQFGLARRSRSLHQLVGCLETMKGVLEASAAGAPDAGLRVTVYLPIENGNTLEQVCDYVATDTFRRRDTAGRNLPATAGVVGRAYQTGKIAIANRIDGDADAHIDDLVKNWGFSKARARRIDPTVAAWMAVPLQTPENGVEAVVFLDAQRRGFFTDNRQLLVLGGCGGLALFVRQRYT